MTICAFLATSLLIALTSPGCIGDNMSRPLKERATWRAAEEAQTPFYLKKPPVASVSAQTFDAIWTAISRVTREAGYVPEMDDHRTGRLITRPFVSSQWFEPWRSDEGSFDGRVAASLATLRRTVYWKVDRQPDGSFHAEPKVLVERFTLVEHRITNNAEYNEVFALTPTELRNQRDRAADPTSFAATGAPPPAYWSAVGRDEPLEKRLASDAQARVTGS